MRHIRNLAWFVLGCLLVAVPIFAHAQAASWRTPSPYGSDSQLSATAQGACTSASASSAFMTGWWPYGWRYQNQTTTGPCQAQLNVSPYTISTFTTAYQTCAAGMELWQGQCKTPCGSGEIRNDSGVCIAACPQGMINEGGTCLPDCAGAAQSGQSTDIGTIELGRNSVAPGYACLAGCQMVPGAGGITGAGGFVGAPVIGATNGLKTWYASGNFKPNGSRCTVTPGATNSPAGAGDGSATQPPTSPADAVAKCVNAGQGWGTVNGVVACTGPAGVVTTGSSGASQGDTNQRTGDPNGPAPGDNQSSNTQKQTTCDGDSCTTTTTKTTTFGGANPDGTGDGSKQTVDKSTKTQSQSEYCKENPEAAVCKGKNQDDWGVAPEEGALTSQAVGPSSITPVSLGGSGSCPAPITLPHNWGQVSYQPACDLAGMIKPITLAFAWLAAVLIAVGGFKDA